MQPYGYSHEIACPYQGLRPGLRKTDTLQDDGIHRPLMAAVCVSTDGKAVLR